MHNYPVFSKDEPLTLNTCRPKVNQNRVFARSFFTLYGLYIIDGKHPTLVVSNVFISFAGFVVL